MPVAELNRLPEDATVVGRDLNRVIDAVLGNDGMQRKWLGYNGQVTNVNTGAAVSTGNYGDIVQTSHGAHTSVRHSAGSTDTPADQVFATNDGYVTIGRGGELRLYNTAGTNYVDLKHSGTNDILELDDGLWVRGGALNVGNAVTALAVGQGWFGGSLNIGSGAPATAAGSTWMSGPLNVGTVVSAADAGDVWAAGGLSVGTYVNPPTGGLVASGTLNVGSVVNAADAGDGWMAGGLSVGTYLNPPVGGLVASGAVNIGTALNATDAGDVWAAGGLCLGTYVNPEAGSVLVTGNPVAAPLANGLYAPNVPKAWALFAAAGSINSSFNVSSIGHPATGRWTVTLLTAFSTAYATVVTVMDPNPYFAHVSPTGYSNSQFEINVRTIAGALVDCSNISFVAFGLQP